MIGLGSIFSLASGGLTFLQGMGIKDSAKNSAKLKNKLVEQRNFYNQKELKRAYGQSLGHSFVAYATQRNEVINNFDKEKDKAISFLGNSQNIEVANSSVSNDLLEEIDQNFDSNLNNNIYPMAINSEGKDEVFVGRIRRDFSLENGLNMWVVADNIRKGAATNSVQIAELLIDKL